MSYIKYIMVKDLSMPEKNTQRSHGDKKELEQGSKMRCTNNTT